MMRVHITGASGSGTTTLGWGLARALRCPRFDSDFYYWFDSWPYRAKRDPAVRNAMLLRDLRAHDTCVSSGSLDSWSEEITAMFDAVIYLWVPADVRIARLRAREDARFSTSNMARDEFDANRRFFLDWAAAYDAGTRVGRSGPRHETWLAGLACPVLRLEGDPSAAERLERALAFLR